jgi:hypothetical protein
MHDDELQEGETGFIDRNARRKAPRTRSITRSRKAVVVKPPKVNGMQRRRNKHWNW